MKYPPVYIIYKQACKYLTSDEVVKLEKKLEKYKDFKGRPFYKALLKNFDIEVFKDNPLIWEDIWLYNYIKYEVTDDYFPRIGLIAKYEKEIFKPNLKKVEKAEQNYVSRKSTKNKDYFQQELDRKKKQEAEKMNKKDYKVKFQNEKHRELTFKSMKAIQEMKKTPINYEEELQRQKENLKKAAKMEEEYILKNKKMEIIEIKPKDGEYITYLIILENDRIIECQYHQLGYNFFGEKTPMMERFIFSYNGDSKIPYSMFNIYNNGAYKLYYTKIIDIVAFFDIKYREIWEISNRDLTAKIRSREIINNSYDFQMQKKITRTDLCYYFNNNKVNWVKEYFYELYSYKLIDESHRGVKNRRLLLNTLIKFFSYFYEFPNHYKLKLKLYEKDYCENKTAKNELYVNSNQTIHHSYICENVINRQINEIKNILKESGYSKHQF